MLMCKDFLWISAVHLQDLLHHLLKDKQIRKHVVNLSVKHSLKRTPALQDPTPVGILLVARASLYNTKER